MKKYMILTLFLFLIGCEKTSDYPWINGTFETALSQADGKLVLVDFETDWCVWCKVLDEKTYPDSAVKAFAEANLVSVKIDAEKGEGIDLAKRYNVTGYPTIVLLDSDGKEVDRIVGYRPPDLFLHELNRIKNGERTIADFEMKMRMDPENEIIITALAEKYEDAGYTDKAFQLWDKVSKMEGEKKELADYKLVIMAFKKDSLPAGLKAYIGNNPPVEFGVTAYSYLTRFYRKSKNEDMEVATLIEQIQYAEENQWEDAGLLNGFAWRMTELEKSEYYDLALAKVQRGIAIAPTEDLEFRAAIIDTEAEVLWKMGRSEEAVERIEVAIDLDPENENYPKQKKKFLAN